MDWQIRLEEPKEGWMATRRVSVLIATIGLLTIATAVFWFSAIRGQDSIVTNSTDFRAFYCAGRALTLGGNPYRVEPVTTCLRETMASQGLVYDERHPLFAPMPPAVIAIFAIISRLPIRLATSLWLASSLVASLFCAWAISRLSGIRIIWATLAVALSLGVASIMLGQIVPIALAGLLTAALATRAARYNLAALGIAVACTEPHLALPAILGLLILVPNSRPALARLAIVIAGASLIIRPDLLIEYLTSVVPAHAFSEVTNFGEQYGLPPLLHAYGVDERTAVRLGSLSYIAMLAVGISLAARLRTVDVAFVVTAPIAAVLLGGPFLHIHQIAAAIPFAAMIVGRNTLSNARTSLAILALTLLAIPWQTVAESPTFADSVPHRTIAQPVPLPSTSPNEQIEIPYKAFIDEYAPRVEGRTREQILAWKTPTWFGLILTLLLGISMKKTNTEDRNTGNSRDRKLSAT